MVYNDNYTDDQGRAVNFNRVQYYLSSLVITHDGGQTTPLTDVYVLTNGNVSYYPLGSFAIDSVESIKLDLGVDAVANAGNTSNYPSSHPLGPQSPVMDWNWPSGYFFLVLNGQVDSDADSTPDKVFEMNAIGDVMLTNVEVTVSSGAVGNTLDIAMDVHVDNWINNIDLTSVSVDHSSSNTNQEMCQNTDTYTVFEGIEQAPLVGVEKAKGPRSYVTADYTMAYAPVLNYNLSSKLPSTLVITDASGKRVIEEANVGFEGNYFILKELKSGVYFATFSNEKEILTCKFLVQR